MSLRKSDSTGSTRLTTRPARNHGDVATFFDSCASQYAEQHGDAQQLLDYRLGLLRSGANLTAADEVLEIGCGNGLHLLALASDYGRGLGIDLSPRMVDAASQRSSETPWADKTSFAVDSAETLSTIADASVDVALCVGSLEHMLDQGAVLNSAFRVLRPGGRLVCLTLNGASLWYRYLAPALSVDTRQLSTDHYLSEAELEHLVAAAGFEQSLFDHWTFIQRGDMPRSIAVLSDGLDRLGDACRIGFFRGGLRVRAIKSSSA